MTCARAWALGAYLAAVVLALMVRSPLSLPWEQRWSFAVLPWLLVSGVLAFTFVTGRFLAFYGVGAVATLSALLVSVPGNQHQRFGVMRPLVNDPLVLNQGSLDRVLFLSPREDQLEARGEGDYAYCLAHLFAQRSVTTYGPMALRIQAWQAGLNSQAEIEDVDAAVAAFLQGHLLETLRVRHVVVPRDHAVLRKACGENPQLRWLRDTRSKSIFVHEGFCAGVLRGGGISRNGA